jgi:AcrR family transcriptional regulator
MPSVTPLRTPLQSRSQKTRAAIVSAARREFEERGYAPSTAKSIAERASVGTGTFYHYFPDKDSVLREITRERAEYLLEESKALSRAPLGQEARALEAEARHRFRKLVDLYVAYHRADRGLHAVITERRLCDPELDAIMAASEREAVSRLTVSLERWGFDGDAPAAAFMMFSLLEGAVHAHVLGQAMVPDDRFAEGLVKALLRIGLHSAFIRLETPAPGDRS